MKYKRSVDGRNPISPVGELGLLRGIRERAARPGHNSLSLGIGDDCALLRVPPGQELAVTTDLSIAGRHFEFHWHPPESVGHRTLARGLSDLAAMGARPLAAFLSLGLPRDLIQNGTSRRAPSWIDRFFDGFFQLADATATPLAGGDISESPAFTADIVLLGSVPRGRALLRSAARPGHLVYVTGTLGGSAASLAALAKWGQSAQPASKRTAMFPPVRLPERLQVNFASHLAPQPRLALGQALVRRHLASAAIDISDGFSTDLAHICEESNVSAEIDASALPIHPSATLDQALHGGEDYELLFTAPPATRIPHTIAGTPITRIGRIVRNHAGRAPLTLLTAQGPKSLAPRGWQHFA